MEKLNTQVLKQVNELPTPTWNHLEINGIDIEVPTVADADEAEAELAAEAEERFAGAACEPPVGGAGEQAQAWLEAAAGEVCRVEVTPGETEGEPIVVDMAQVARASFALDVVIGAGAQASVVLVGNAPESETLGTTSGWSVRIAVEEGAKLDLFSVVACGAPQMLDNVGIVAQKGASVRVKQYVLDAGLSATGFRCDLVGDGSTLELDARYLGRGEQTLDLGHVVRQIGKHTLCTMAFSGVLADNAFKSLRDTIDLVRGCKGSKGSENETVLLAGDGVGNQSLPVILCDEDDVAGDHGATVGEISPEQRAYLVSRGLAPEDIPALVMESTFAAAFQDAPVPQATACVRAAAERVLGADVVADMLGE